MDSNVARIVLIGNDVKGDIRMVYQKGKSGPIEKTVASPLIIRVSGGPTLSLIRRQERRRQMEMRNSTSTNREIVNQLRVPGLPQRCGGIWKLKRHMYNFANDATPFRLLKLNCTYDPKLEKTSRGRVAVKRGFKEIPKQS